MYERHVQARRDSEVDAEEEDGAIRTLLHFQTEQVLLLQLARVGWSTTVIMPLLELGAIAYVTWVLVYQICIQYLLKPSDEFRQNFNIQPRRATGIALVVIYAVLLLLLLVPWSRLLQVIWSRPDVVPLGDTSVEQKEVTTSWLGEYDAYICDYQGMPLWCDKCHNWKPDRTHHCKELGRCVRKMDHYCPWAGGIIAETTHKYFMQFVSFAALYTAFAWIVTAVFLSERISKVSIYSIPAKYGLVRRTLTCHRQAHAQARG